VTDRIELGEELAACEEAVNEIRTLCFKSEAELQVYEKQSGGDGKLVPFHHGREQLAFLVARRNKLREEYRTSRLVGAVDSPTAPRTFKAGP
jgi:hypothetical protein